MGGNKTNSTPGRRYKAYVSVLGTTQLHLRNPWVIAWWSAAFPGLGHLLLSKYLRGFALFAWEVVINYQAHINVAIIYSFTGRFDMAKQVLDIKWLLLYIPTYMFAIWDSYRTTVDINGYYLLAAREDAEIKPFRISALEINYLDKRTPWVSFVWSIFMPGAGQIYIHRIITAFFILIWWIVISYLSRLLPAIHYSFLGDFEQAKAVIQPQWFLNIGSVHLFAIYDAYTNTVENNKLFDWEQAKFFKKNYQYESFHMPLRSKNEGGSSMYVVTSFEHSKYLELAVTAIEMKGIPKENILGIPLDKRNEERALFDTIHYSDGMSLIDLAAIMGTIFMVLGSIYGFILKWGPLIWGLIGMVGGFGLGLLIKLLLVRKNKDKLNNRKASEIILIIECRADQAEMVKDILWAHHALGVSKLSLGEGK